MFSQQYVESGGIFILPHLRWWLSWTQSPRLTLPSCSFDCSRWMDSTWLCSRRRHLAERKSSWTPFRFRLDISCHFERNRTSWWYATSAAILMRACCTLTRFSLDSRWGWWHRSLIRLPGGSACRSRTYEKTRSVCRTPAWTFPRPKKRMKEKFNKKSSSTKVEEDEEIFIFTSNGCRLIKFWFNGKSNINIAKEFWKVRKTNFSL